MKSPNNGRDRAHLAISCHQYQDWITSKLTCWSKVFHGSLQPTQAVPMTIGGSPQTDSKAPLLKTTSTQLTEHRDVKLLPG